MTLADREQERIADQLTGDASQFSVRERELLGQAGDRIFHLARRLGSAEKEIERLKGELTLRDELIAETRNSRDVLAAQVNALLIERERDYDERTELRRLFAGTQVKLQDLLDRLAPPFPQLPGPMGRLAAQRSSGITNGPEQGRSSRSEDFLKRAGHDIRGFLTTRARPRGS